MSEKFRLLCRDAVLCASGAAVLTGILYFLFVNLHVFDPFEKAFEDFNFTDIYSARLVKADYDDSIIIVNIKDAGREKIAEALNSISRNNPKVIGIDAIFKDPKNPVEDSTLAAALSAHRNKIVGAFKIDGNKITRNYAALFKKIPDEGYINVNFSQQGAVVRNFQASMRQDHLVYHSFAYMVSKKAGLLDSGRQNNFDSALKINYSTNESSFRVFDIDELLKQKAIPAMTNAIVLLGYMGNPTNNKNDVEDKHFTPMNYNYAGKSLPDMHGIIIHANIIKMISESRYIVQLPKVIIFILAFLSAVLIAMIGLLIHSKSPLFYHLLLKILELFVTVMFLYFALMLLKNDIHIYIEPIIILSLVSLEMVILYDHLLPKLYKRWKWKSYLSH